MPVDRFSKLSLCSRLIVKGTLIYDTVVTSFINKTNNSLRATQNYNHLPVQIWLLNINVRMF